MIKKVFLILPILLYLFSLQPAQGQEVEVRLTEDSVWLKVTFTGNVLEAFGLNFDLPFNVFDPIEGELIVQGALVDCELQPDQVSYVLTFSEHPRVAIKNLINGAEFKMTDYPMWDNAATVPGTLTLTYLIDLGHGEQYTMIWSYQHLEFGLPGSEFGAGVAAFSPDVIPDGSNLDDTVGDAWGRITNDITTSPQRMLKVSVDPDWGCMGGLLCGILPEVYPCALVAGD